MRLARAGTLVALAVLFAACDTARTVEHVQPVESCTRCHGYPPPPYATSAGSNHPANPDCHLCHPGTVEADNVTIIPASAGGLHMDGVVEATGGHAVGYADPAQHGPDALAFLGGSGTLACTDCHGVDFAGGSSQKSCTACHAAASPSPGFADWQTNCTFCHGTRTPSWTAAQLALAAPPETVAGTGDQTRANAKVGAHQAHLAAGTYAAALTCDACHAVPAAAAALTHFQGTGGQAALSFSALALQGGAAGTYSGGSCAVYCHGSGSLLSGGANPSPAWTSTGLACDACHGQPPQTGPTAGGVLAPNAHAFHVAAGATCGSCHLGYTAASVNVSTHVNGTREAVVLRASDSAQVTIAGWDCAACHGALVVPATTHAVPYPTHGAEALPNFGACTTCHGADFNGGLGGLAPSCNGCHASQVAASAPDWKTNCTFCHGTRTADVTTATAAAAPPAAVDGSTGATKVGAHQKHLAGGALSSGYACDMCHTVPTDALGHFAGYTGGPAPVTFGAIAKQGAASAAYTGGSCTVYCHGNGSQGATATDAWPIGSVAAASTPAWSSSPLACDACHASRPRTPRRIVSGVVQDVTGAGSHYSNQHLYLGTGTTSGPQVPCASCHLGYVQDTSVDPALHADGRRTVSFTTRGGGVRTVTNPGWSDCTLCHDGTANGNANAPAF